MSRLRISLFAATVILAGCTNFSPQPSEITPPSSWSRLPDTGKKAPLVTEASAHIDHQWWKHFNDPILDALIGEALNNNKDLQIAKARVEEARALSTGAFSDLLPKVGGSGDASRGNQGLASNNQVINVGQISAQASWELDLFGANKSRAAQANAILESEEATQKAVRVTLLADVARAYFDMRNYQRQVEINQRNVDTQRKTLDLIKAQQKGALASELDVQRAGAQVSTTESESPAFKSAYDAALNRISVLLGNVPGTREETLKQLQPFQPLDAHVIVAAPASVIAARPDVQAAERTFAASLAARDAAVADLFPKISLLAMFGIQESSVMSGLTPWSLGGSLIQPLLNFGTIEAQIDAADARQKQQFLAYQQTVLRGLEDMENALSSYLHETSSNRALSMAVEANRKSEKLSKDQYTNGYAALLDVLVAERDLLRSESNLATSDAMLRKDLIAIYAASGGGWSDAPAPVVSTTTTTVVTPTETLISTTKAPEAAPVAVAPAAPTPLVPAAPVAKTTTTTTSTTTTTITAPASKENVATPPAALVPGAYNTPRYIPVYTPPKPVVGYPKKKKKVIDAPASPAEEAVVPEPAKSAPSAAPAPAAAPETENVFVPAN
jgi:multidrug efflux system outer membrane protein